MLHKQYYIHNVYFIAYILYYFVQFGRPLSHLIFSDTGFERFKYFRFFWDFSKNKKSQPLAELIEMVQYFWTHIMP